MRRLLSLIILLTLISCSNSIDKEQTEKKETRFTETGLRVACTRTIKSLDNDIHGTHYLNKSRNEIDKDSILNMLYSISLLDDFNKNNCIKYSIGSFESWNKITKTDKCYKLEKTEYRMKSPRNSNINSSAKTSITLTDFDLYLNGQTKKITLRFLNDDELTQISVDNCDIYRITESIPVGFGSIIQKLDSLKTEQKKAIE